MRSLFGGDGALVEIEERFPHFGRNEGLSAGLEKCRKDAGATKSTWAAICDRREDLSWGESKPAPSKN
jgi:hypothetical protein